MQPAISFAIREKLYEVSFFIAWLMYHVPKLCCIEVISVTLYTHTYIDCNSKCSFNKGNQDEQEGSPGVRVYSSQVSITFISYLICFDERFYFVEKIPTYSCHHVFLWYILFCLPFFVDQLIISKGGTTAVDLVKLFGQKSSVIRWVSLTSDWIWRCMTCSLLCRTFDTTWCLSG